MKNNLEDMIWEMKVWEVMELLKAGRIFCGSCGKQAERLFGECDCGVYKPMLVPEGLLMIGCEKQQK